MTAVRLADPARLPFWAAVFVGLVCICILTISAGREWGSRAVDLHNAEVDMSNLARSMTQHAEDSFELLDASIIGVVSRLNLDGTGPASIAALTKILEHKRAGLTRIRGLFIYDETGGWLATSERLDLTGRNNADRDYFRHHIQSESLEPFIGPPVKSRSNGEWIITLSRRFNHPDGRFAGVVLATIGAEYFAEFYRQFQIGSHGSIALLSQSGIVIARSPDNGTFIGRDLSATPLIREAALRPAAGAYYFVSPLDGLQRVSFYKRSGRYPLLLLATLAQDEVLAPWRKNAIIRVSVVLALTSLIAVIGFFLVRQLHQRQRLMLALAAKEADFRLLAEESSDMVTRIGLDERIRYVSPSSLRIVGWGPEQLTGTPALAGVNAEDRPGIDTTVAALKRGEIGEARLTYRSRHREAKEVWIESNMRATRNAETGQIDGLVAISRDVTEQTNAQQKLAALAILDGLTGIANRRRFDERLKEEWARARRDGTSLSLLLIDVDHFKKFNDQYGHPAGDACLQAIATTLAAEARRPADLAARYGGEEFALLLPSTDPAGCKLVGKRIRQRLRELALPHAKNPPSNLVTVSVGGASFWPSAQGTTEGSSLIEAADRALYLAKGRGRDRLIMAEQAVTRDVA